MKRSLRDAVTLGSVQCATTLLCDLEQVPLFL